VIDCGRFYLRTMRIKDFDNVCALFSYESAKMLSESYGSSMKKEDLYNSLQSKLCGNVKNCLFFLAFLKKSGNLLGYASVNNIDWVKGCGEISTLIDEKYQFLGYGTMLTYAVVSYCYKTLNLIRIYSKIRSDNDFLPERAEGQVLRCVPDDMDHIYDYYYVEHLKDQQ